MRMHRIHILQPANLGSQLRELLVNCRIRMVSMNLRMKRLWIDELVLLLILYFPISESGNEQLIAPESHECACSGTVLTFNCTTVGFGTTLWKGTAFNCQNNQIILLNSLFSSGGTGSSGRCGDNIVARGIMVDGNCHTSQLNITVLSEVLNQTSVECMYSSNQGLKTVGRVVITVLLSHYPPPSNLVITNASSEKITFIWLSTAPLCSSSIHYLITASDCGVCPQIVTNTTATCHNLQPSTEIRECRFSVQNVVCGVMGNTSEAVLERIGVPTISQLAVVPRFMSSNQMLHSLEGFIDSVITVPASVTGYNISFLSPSGSIIRSETILIPCYDQNCAVDVVSLCSSSPSINFTASAINNYGQGPPSNINTIGCMNEFIKVEYDSKSSTLSCQFLMMDTSEKSCNISYRICQSTKTKNISNSSTSNLITLSLSLNPGMYCFQVKASKNTFKIIVEGSWIIIAGATTPEAAIIGFAVSVPVVVILVLAVIIIIILLCAKSCKRVKTVTSEEEIKVNMNLSDIKLKKLSKTTDDYEIVMIDVDSDTSLRQCVESKTGEFQRDCAFYEFTHEIERILEKELIFMKDNDIDQLFTPQVDQDRREECGLSGEKLKCPTELKPQNFKLFVQSMGSGKRHVSAGSHILYKKYHKDKQPSARQRPDVSIISIWQKQFVTKPVQTPGTLKDNNLKAGEVFLSINMTPDLKALVDDVIVVTKKNDKVISVMTGPSARMMEDFQNPETTVLPFYLGKSFSENMHLTMETQITYQNSEQEATFLVLEVGKDQDSVQMLAFIKQKLGDNEFVNGDAFYEFNETEDLLYYKEVLHVTDDELEHRQITLKSDISYFYELPKTPGLNIEPPKGKDYRVFLQSTSQGSRCLKANSLLLYRGLESDNNEAETCPVCGKGEDGSPMICCDAYNRWHHWNCEQVMEEPTVEEEW